MTYIKYKKPAHEELQKILERLHQPSATLNDLAIALRKIEISVDRREALTPIINLVRLAMGGKEKKHILLADILPHLETSLEPDFMLIHRIKIIMTLTTFLSPPVVLPLEPTPEFKAFLEGAGPDASDLRLLALFAATQGWLPEDISDEKIQNFGEYLDFVTTNRPIVTMRATAKAFNTVTRDNPRFNSLSSLNSPKQRADRLVVGPEIAAEIDHCIATLKDFLPSDITDDRFWSEDAVEKRRGPRKESTGRSFRTLLLQAVCVLAQSEYALLIDRLADFKALKVFRALRRSLEASAYASSVKHDCIEAVLLMLHDFIKISSDEYKQLASERLKMGKPDRAFQMDGINKIRQLLTQKSIESLRASATDQLDSISTFEAEDQLRIAQEAIVILIVLDKPLDAPDIRCLQFDDTLRLTAFGASIEIEPAQRWNKIRLYHDLHPETANALRKFLGIATVALGTRPDYLLVNKHGSVKDVHAICDLVRNYLRQNQLDLSLTDVSNWHALTYLAAHPDDYIGLTAFLGLKAARGTKQRFEHVRQVAGNSRRHSSKLDPSSKEQLR